MTSRSRPTADGRACRRQSVLKLPKGKTLNFSGVYVENRLIAGISVKIVDAIGTRDRSNGDTRPRSAISCLLG